MFAAYVFNSLIRCVVIASKYIEAAKIDFYSSGSLNCTAGNIGRGSSRLCKLKGHKRNNLNTKSFNFYSTFFAFSEITITFEIASFFELVASSLFV